MQILNKPGPIYKSHILYVQASNKKSSRGEICLENFNAPYDGARKKLYVKANLAMLINHYQTS